MAGFLYSPEKIATARAGVELGNKKAGQWFTEIQRSRKRDLLPREPV